MILAGIHSIELFGTTLPSAADGNRAFDDELQELTGSLSSLRLKIS